MTRMQHLNDAFQALTYSEMKAVAEALNESIHAACGVTLKDTVIAFALDALGAWLEIEAESED
jgi:hypothetical protein